MDIHQQALEIAEAAFSGQPLPIDAPESHLDGACRQYAYRVVAADIPGYTAALFHRPLVTPLIVVNKNLSWSKQEQMAALIWSLFLERGLEARQEAFELKFRVGGQVE